MNELDPVWRALGDPTRRRMLQTLRSGARTTGELCEAVPGMSRHGVIKHLKLLQAAGLVRVEHRGRVRLNHLVPEPLNRIREEWLVGFDGPGGHGDGDDRSRDLPDPRRPPEGEGEPQ